MGVNFGYLFTPFRGKYHTTLAIFEIQLQALTHASLRMQIKTLLLVAAQM